MAKCLAKQLALIDLVAHQAWNPMARPVKRPRAKSYRKNIAQELAMLCRFHGWWQMVPANHPSIFLGCLRCCAPLDWCSQSQKITHKDMSYIELPSGNLLEFAIENGH
jgi:hypothetical protein